MSLATFNVRSLNDINKRKELARDLLRYGVDICCVQETKIKEDVDGNVEDYRFFNLENGSYHGLGFFVHKNLEQRVTNVRATPSGNIAVIQLKINDVSIAKRFTIINVHAPTAEHDEREHENFYQELSSVYDKHRNDTVVLICGDFNAEVGKRTSSDTCVGSHTTNHARTEMGQNLVEFSEKKDLFVCNTAFEQSTRAKMTHFAHDKNRRVYFRQIDYFLCKRYMKGMLTDCRTYGKSINSDHRLLVARMDMPRYYGLTGMRRKTQPSRKIVRYQVDRFEDATIREKYCTTLSAKLAEIKENASGKETWAQLVTSVKVVAERTIGVARKEKDARQCAFNDTQLAEWSNKQRKIRIDILSCTDKAKCHSMKTERNRLLRAMRKRVNELRMKMIEEKVAEIDKCKDSARQFAAIKIVKEINQKRQKLVVNNEEGERIMDDEAAAEYVRKHFISQFSDINKPPLEAHPTDPRPLNTPIQPAEVQKVALGS